MIRIAFGGDLLLSDALHQSNQTRALSRCEAAWASKSDIWGTALPVLRSADAVVANLETPVSDRQFRIPSVAGKRFKGWGFQIGSGLLKLLRAVPVSVVTLANNHLQDTVDGVGQTIRHLDSAGILHAGAGANLSEAQAPATIAVRGTRIAVLSVADLRSITDGTHETAPYVRSVAATPTTAGIWDMHTQPHAESLALNFSDRDFASVRVAVERARLSHDIVIVCLHFQPNIAGFRAQAPFQRLAARIIDAGADAFVGTHPHHMQAMATHRGRPLIMGAGELLRSHPNKALVKMDYTHHVVYELQFRPPATATRSAICVGVDLRLIKLDPDRCRVDLESQMAAARARVQAIHNSLRFSETPTGLRLAPLTAQPAGVPGAGGEDSPTQLSGTMQRLERSTPGWASSGQLIVPPP